MTTARHAAPRPANLRRRRRELRRLRREKILVALFLLAVLLVTVVLLALQWLHPGSTSNAVGPVLTRTAIGGTP